LYFKLSYSKFARDLQNIQTQTPNTQKIENLNLNLWVLFGCICPLNTDQFSRFKYNCKHTNFGVEVQVSLGSVAVEVQGLRVARLCRIEQIAQGSTLLRARLLDRL